MEYAELHVTTNYSFLRGGSHPGELVFQAANLGHYAIGITDRNTLAGVVRAEPIRCKQKLRVRHQQFQFAVRACVRIVERPLHLGLNRLQAGIERRLIIDDVPMARKRQHQPVRSGIARRVQLDQG